MAAGSLPQMDLNFMIEKPDWVALKILIEEIEDELAQNRRNLLFSLANWYMAVNIFKRFENHHMIDSEANARDLDYHRVMLTGIMATGERVLLELRRHEEVDTEMIGIDLEDVEATVEEFRIKYQEWFHDMKPERQAEILKEVFGAGCEAAAGNSGSAV